MNPSYINDQIVLCNKKGNQIVTNAKKYPLNNYDVILKDKSLKQLEAFMGHEIKESDVPFDIDRPLTELEVEEIVKYNIHDVLETLSVLDETSGDFEAQLDMIEMFNLDMEMFNRTKAQLASTILGAVQQHTLDDEMDISMPSNLKMPEKYKYIIDWYNKPENKSYKLPLKTDVDSNSVRQLITSVADVPCVYGYGGLHGSKDNSIVEGILLAADVASLYPSLMINENFASRKLRNPKDFENMRNRRLELKKVKDKRQQPLKIVINSAYGILKDRNSPCFDPVQSNNVCISGQLYLTELVANLEGKCEILQLNTDGIYLRVNNESDIQIVQSIAKQWENRTKLELEWDVYKNGRLVQNDVNNYLLIDKDTGKYKCKGAYVKKLSLIDNDLPILNKALVNYFVHDIPVEDTINSATMLIDFQKVIKLTSLYKGVVYGDGIKVKSGNKERVIVENGVPLKEKVHRVFASNRDSDKGIYKMKVEKGETSYEKVAYTPDRCFIDNNDITNKKVPIFLDRQYYIDMAKERIRQFLEKEEVTVDETPNILFECMTKASDYYSFLVNVQNTSITKKVLENYLIANSCAVYGKTKRLLEFKKYFDMFYGKSKLTVSSLFKKLNDDIDIFNIVTSNSELNKTGKTYTNFNYEKALKEIFAYLPNDDISIYEIIKMQIDKFNEIRFTDSDYDEHVWFVLNYRDVISPNIIIYNIKTGEIKYIKVKKEVFNILPLQDGDLIKVDNVETTFASKIIGKDENGINITALDIDKTVQVITKYEIIDRHYDKNTKLVSEQEAC